MIAPTKKWIARPRVPDDAASKLRVPHLVAQLLYHRGVRDASALEAFLDTGTSLLHDPFLMPGMNQAVRRLYRALLSMEKVAVFGDFDVDGISGTVLLTKALEGLGATVVPYIPHRVREGHGLNCAAIQELKDQGVSLLVTVDCGLTSGGEVEEAKSLGIDVVVTDHHALPTVPPPAYAIVSPALEGGAYPFRELSGAGLALKLTQGLYQFLGREWNSGLLELAALGTVADVVPLLDENRVLVREGLRVIRQSPSASLSELCRRAGIDSRAVDTEAISYIIAPRLNAPGRLGDALTSYRLLAATSTEEAGPLAEELEALNRERQRLTQEAFLLARQEVVSREPLPSLLFVAREEFVPGVNGLVASKLAEEFYRPAVVASLADVARGSARSIPEFDIAKALSQCSDLLQRYGGHPRAAGFVAAPCDLRQLQKRLTGIAEKRLAGVDLTPCVVVDAEVSLGDLNGEFFRWLGRLEPYGEGNPAPVFLSRDVEVVRAWPLGTSGNHLRLTVRSGGVTWDAVAFNVGEERPEVPSQVDLVYSLGTEPWQGRTVMSLSVIDIAVPGRDR